MSRIDHVRNLYEMCTLELLTLHRNVCRFQENSKQFLSVIEEHWDDIDDKKAIASIAYDKFLSNLSNVMDMSRKYNLHMQLYYLERDSRQIFHDGLRQKHIHSNETKTEREFGSQKNHHILRPNSSLGEGEESVVTFGSTNAKVVKCNYQKKDVSVYERGSVLYGWITYISDPDMLGFFVLDTASLETSVLLNQNVVNYRQFMRQPYENEIFGFPLDGVVWRAIRCDPLNSSKKSTQNDAALLLDVGEVVEISKNSVMYHLPSTIKKKAAQAIPCKLHNQGDATNRDELKQQLQGLLYQKCEFLVHSVEDGTLLLQFQAEEPHLKEMPIKTSTNPFLDGFISEEAIPLSALPHETINCDANPPNGLTPEDLDMLYEEPLCTSNAMKAVMGYDPKDDSRICRFYDPKIRGCFKGANCRQEHTSRQPDGWTKDVLPAATIIDDRAATIVYAKNTVLNITPTHVWQLERFYAQISNTKETTMPLIWDNDDVPEQNRLHKLPYIFEIVLARYEDGFWYRARVMEIYEESNMVKLFYVDYGNKQTIHLRELASCSYALAKLPTQAVLCRLAGVRDADATPEQRQEGINFLRDAILNQSIDVRVVNHIDDLVVHFVDKRFNKLPTNLIEMGCMQTFNS